MTMLPKDATSYLLQLHKAYRTGSVEEPQYLVMYVSPQLMALYSHECETSTRFTSAMQEQAQAYYLRQSRIKADPDLRGFNIRYLEDEYAWRH